MKRPRIGSALTIVTILASGGILFGVSTSLEYAFTAAPADTPPSVWPAASRIELAASGATIILFLHSECPCSFASVWEMQKLVERHPTNLAARVVFCRPRDGDQLLQAGWLPAAVDRIPEVQIIDDGYDEAARFHARTSGETYVYGADGTLLFHGGLTPARGHVGDSLGSAAINRIAAAEPVTCRESIVFGCALAR